MMTKYERTVGRLGASVTGVDPSGSNIAVASRHAAQSVFAIDYRAATAENVARLPARSLILFSPWK